MKKIYFTIMLVMLALSSCSKDDSEGTFTLEVNVNYQNDILNKMIYEDGAEVYVFEYIEAWKDSPSNWEYTYLDNGYIKSNLTNNQVKYTQFKLTSTGTATFEVPKGLHTVVIKSNKIDDWTMVKINMNKSQTSTYEFK